MGAFLSISCSLPVALEEEIPTLLFEIPVLGTEIKNRRDDRIDVTVFLADTEIDRTVEVQSLIAAAGGDRFEVVIVEEEDWMENYRRVVQPFEVGSTWWVDPRPDTPTAAPEGRKRLVVPPRMAFGSGSHESTRLILGSLETADLRGRTVLDVGTGSGILALASETMGAQRVLGVDIDPVAIRIACQIRDLQEWQPRVHYVTGSVGCAAPALYDFVLCNMISAHSIPLLDAMTTALAPGGILVLAGLLVEEVESVTGELEQRGLMTSPMIAQNEWASLSAGWSR
ncbi:MAG: 50S ribosomal protein L11 methyltransferase [Acidobacteriota bacterium]|nr:50S ribosomal protein L11 methyltransferase [Acidobacteriota bacterium]